jgi:3-hydroxyanthranilate 3,4-dioxygenase
MAVSMPINFRKWIDDNRDKFKPPVMNEVIWRDTDFIVMVVGGPNVRTDYHVDPYEELFYMVEGDMVLPIVDDGAFKDIHIKEGEMFLLPPNVPHSPQRFENTVGLVIERTRPEGVKEAFQWYCKECSSVLYEEWVQLKDITKDLLPVFDRFYGDDNNRTCKNCGWEMPPRDQ